MRVRGGRRGTAWALGALAVTLLYMGARADGLHCKVLNGDDLEESWRQLVRQTWADRKDGVAPRVSSHRERPLVETAIKELLSVIQFVDAYNYADDSPPWMATEVGRGKAREQARKILVELGRGAAPFVWQTSENEIRFSTGKERPDTMVKPYREAQTALREACQLLEGERRQDAAYVKAYDAMVELRPKVHALEYLEKLTAELRRTKISAKAERLKEVEDELARAEARIKNLGDLRELGQKFKDLQATMAECLKTVDEGAKVAELKAAAEAARKKLEAAMQAAGGLGQGLLDGGDPVMVSSEDFLGNLKEILTEMGPEAIAQVNAGLRSPNAALRTYADGIMTAWTAPGRAIEFAKAAADGKTQVALGASKFLRDRFKTTAVEPLLQELAKAPEADRPAIFAGLRAATAADIADDAEAWKKWWTENKPNTKKTQALQDE